MAAHLQFLLLGLGGGAVIAALAIAVTLTYRVSGVVNFAYAATGMYVAYAYFEFRATGELVLPGIGLPDLDDAPIASADTDLYIQVIESYGDGLDWAGAGTVSFRGLMNLYDVLVELGPDDISSESIVVAFQSKVDEPSFNGHAYTCDGEQVPALPALCSPQQVLGLRHDGSLVEVSDGWVDVPALVAELPSS